MAASPHVFLVAALLAGSAMLTSPRPLEFKLGLLAPWTGTGNDGSSTSDDVIGAATSAGAVGIAMETVHGDVTLNETVRLRSVRFTLWLNSKF